MICSDVLYENKAILPGSRCVKVVQVTLRNCWTRVMIRMANNSCTYVSCKCVWLGAEVFTYCKCMHAVCKWKQFQAVNKCSAAQQLHVHRKKLYTDGENSDGRWQWKCWQAHVCGLVYACIMDPFASCSNFCNCITNTLDVNECTQTMPQIYSLFNSVKLMTNTVCQRNGVLPSSSLVLPRFRFPFSAVALKPWNVLLQSLTEASSLSFFKTQLKTSYHFPLCYQSLISI